jgi:hypothetical protein
MKKSGYIALATVAIAAGGALVLLLSRHSDTAPGMPTSDGAVPSVDTPTGPRTGSAAAQGHPDPSKFAGGRSAPAESHPVVNVSVSPNERDGGGPGLAIPGAALNVTECFPDDSGVLRCGDCQVDTDCPKNNACILDLGSRQMKCLPADCRSDADCPPDEACRAASAGITGTPIRRCTPTGRRKVGETCEALPRSAAGACERDLLCIKGYCGRRCAPAADGGTGCAASEVCYGDADGFGCAPSCEASGCPAGKSCVHMEGGVSICAREQRGENCLTATPCPAGRRCIVTWGNEKVDFSCDFTCDALAGGKCPDGFVCGALATKSVCYRACDPEKASPCGQNEMCATVDEGMSVFGCRPDVWFR